MTRGDKTGLYLLMIMILSESAKVDISRVCKCVLFSSVRETPVMTAIKIIKVFSWRKKFIIFKFVLP